MSDEEIQSPDASEPDAVFDGSLSMGEALQRLRTRLLDLTSRNRLINYRHPRGKSLQVVDVDFDAVFTRLIEGKACVFRPVPEPAPLEYSGQKPEARQHAQRIGIPVSAELPVPGRGPAAHPNTIQALRALYYPEDLERTLRRMARDANTAIEETGTNMLYLVFGFLEFQEVAHADQPLTAPLVALPVSLARKRVDPSTGYYEYEIIHNGEDYSENVTLREKLKHEFATDLPELQEEDTAESYLQQVAGRVERRPGWKVRRRITLGFLSFGKLAIWADLDPSRRQTFLHHPQVKTILTGDRHDISEEPEDHRVDEHATLDSLVYDADTSQHRALIDVLAGKSLVINGPPGTGKSQTITNIIAAAMARGQSVLFVSEKLAALEVVKSRLDKAGLGHFCLELHSHKSNKKKLLEEIDARVQRRFPEPSQIEEKLHSLRAKRGRLDRYAELMNAKVGNELGKTVHGILWAAERRRNKLGAVAEQVTRIVLPQAPECRPDELETLRSLVEGLRVHFSEISSYDEAHPWYGFFPTSLAPGQDLAIQSILEAHIETARVLRERLEEFQALVGTVKGAQEAEFFIRLARVFSEVAAPPANLAEGLLAMLFLPSDPEGVRTEGILVALQENLQRVRNLEAQVRDKVLIKSLTAQHLEQAKVHVRRLAPLGLAGRKISEINQLVRQCSELKAGASEALAGLRELAEIADLPFEGSERDLMYLRCALSIAKAAPADLLPYRCPSLAEQDARGKLQRARAQMADLQHRRARLSRLFFLDHKPDEHALDNALAALRQGDDLVNWLRKDWRQARRFYRSLAKHKSRLASVLCARQLSEIRRLLDDEHAFVSNTSHIEAFGRLFAGFDTDWSKIERLIEWYERSDSILVETAAPAPAIDLTALPAVALGQLAARAQRGASYFERLDHTGQSIHRLLPADFVIEPGSPERRKAWPLVLRTLELVTQALQAAAQFFSHLVPINLTPQEAWAAIHASLTLPREQAALEAGEWRQLLGPFFRGLQTEVAGIQAAHTWGKKLVAAGIPYEVYTFMFRADAQANLLKVRHLTAEVATAWADLDQLPERLMPFGKFQCDVWKESVVRSEGPSWEALLGRSERALSNMDQLLPWSQYNAARSAAADRRLERIISVLENQKIPPAQLPLAFEFIFLALRAFLWVARVAKRPFGGRGTARTAPFPWPGSVPR